MPLKQHPTDPDKMIYVSRQYDIPQLQGVTATQPCTWVGLTDEEIITAYETSGHKQSIRPQDVFAVASLARTVEAKLKEKNT